MEQDLSGIMDKIARLKSLAERPGTPEEAAAAVAGIQRLMTRYNLTQMQVNTAERNTESGFEKVSVNLGATLRWRQSLMNTVAETSYCRFVRNWKGNFGHIIGEQHNVVVAKELYEYLVKEIDRLATEKWETEGFMHSANKRTWCHAFRVGASVAVSNRLHNAWIADKQEQVNEETALVVLYEDQLENAMAKYFPGSFRQNINMTTRNNNGLESGKRAGNNINLAKQIAG